jgi:hypothetical protein
VAGIVNRHLREFAMRTRVACRAHRPGGDPPASARGRLWLVSYRAGLPAISRRERPGPRTYQVRTSRSAAGDGSSAGKAAVCGGPRPAIEELELAMNTPPIISVGATGPTVTWAQYLLVRWVLSYTQIDGIFRPVTKTAVEQFQAESHLAALNAFRGRALLMTHLPVAGLPGLLCRPARGSEPGGARSHRGLRRGQCRSAGRRPAICIVP